MRFQFYLLFFLFNLFFNSSLWAQRIGFSFESWKVIKTEHFDVIFSAEQQDLGLYYAQAAEKAYANLATVFTNRTDHMVLVVNDTTDISNGYATRIPYPLIMAYSVQIGDHESLSEAGEWARELLTHELTHILQFEPAESFYGLLKPIFGNIVAPNMLMPLWWKEGMAVEMETQFSPQGRARSKYQDASLRALVLDRKLFEYTLPQANEVLPSWPYGSRAYLFGSIFWSHLLSTYKIAAADQIVNRQGERVPYMIEEPMREITGDGYEAQYNEALYKVDRNASQQLSRLNSSDVTNFMNLPQVGQNSFAPRVSTKHQLLAYIEQTDGESKIVVKNFQNEYLKLKRAPKEGLSGLDFHPTETKILYTKADFINSKYKRSDLFIYDLETQKSDRITSGERTRDASFSEDGNSVVYISALNGSTQVRTIHLGTRAITHYADSGFENRYNSPIFWSTDTILVTKRDKNGVQSLYKINLSDKKETFIPLAFEQIRFLRKKNQSLYFTSSKNGAHNVYVTTDLKTAAPVTNTLTGIWSYDIDVEKNKIWATLMTGHGYHVSTAEISSRKNDLPVIENEIDKRYTFKDTPDPKANYELNDYESTPYLLPRYWIPYIATSTSAAGVYLQAQTSGQDPLGIHQYSLLASFETDIGKTGFIGSYTNSAWVVPFQIGSVVQNQTFGDINNIVETKSAYVGLLPDMFQTNKNLIFQIGVKTEETVYLANHTQHWGPYVQTAYIDYTQNIFQISPEKGWGAFLRYESNQNSLNSRDFNRAMGTLLGYYSELLPKHHVLMARLNGLMTFESVSARFGSSNAARFYSSDILVPQFVLRGYLDGQFYGRSLASFNGEYRFPVVELERGSGSDPFFAKRISGALLIDGLSVEGGSITEAKTFQARSLNDTVWNSGIEFKLETTIGYVLPVNFVLGFYVPHSPKYVSSTQSSISLQIGGL
ncbi:MAG: hypothetical protein H7328_13405 [Bdellovibrio sp.]|nr:hypothetical protein [Bdellovibrio sp.]